MHQPRIHLDLLGSIKYSPTALLSVMMSTLMTCRNNEDIRTTEIYILCSLLSSSIGTAEDSVEGVSELLPVH